jgi:hypothetical protein
MQELVQGPGHTHGTSLGRVQIRPHIKLRFQLILLRAGVVVKKMTSILQLKLHDLEGELVRIHFCELLAQRAWVSRVGEAPPQKSVGPFSLFGVVCADHLTGGYSGFKLVQHFLPMIIEVIVRREGQLLKPLLLAVILLYRVLPASLVSVELHPSESVHVCEQAGPNLYGELRRCTHEVGGMYELRLPQRHALLFYRFWGDGTRSPLGGVHKKR